MCVVQPAVSLGDSLSRDQQQEVAFKEAVCVCVYLVWFALTDRGGGVRPASPSSSPLTSLQPGFITLLPLFSFTRVVGSSLGPDGCVPVEGSVTLFVDSQSGPVGEDRYSTAWVWGWDWGIAQDRTSPVQTTPVH